MQHCSYRIPETRMYISYLFRTHCNICYSNSLLHIFWCNRLFLITMFLSVSHKKSGDRYVGRTSQLATKLMYRVLFIDSRRFHWIVTLTVRVAFTVRAWYSSCWYHITQRIFNTFAVTDVILRNLKIYNYLSLT